MGVRAGDLEGKVALVTGAAGGIGRAVVDTLLSAGAAVVAVDLEPDGIVSSERVLPVRAQLADEAQVVHALTMGEDRLGGVDIVFNGAGISGRRLGDGPVDTIPMEAWDRVLDANLKSVYLVSKHAIPALRRRGGGAIVNLASVLGLVGDRDFVTHAYAASKGAIVALTRAMAVAYAPEGIRCNVICPGLIATPMSARAAADENVRRRIGELQPLRSELGEPADVAGAVEYLATASFVTGAVLTVDGGWTAH